MGNAPGELPHNFHFLHLREHGLQILTFPLRVLERRDVGDGNQYLLGILQFYRDGGDQEVNGHNLAAAAHGAIRTVKKSDKIAK